MEINVGYRQYQIKIFEDHAYTENSTDNRNFYKHIIRFDENSCIVSKHAIQVLLENEIKASAILLGAGGGTSIHENGFIIENERIYFCAGDALFCLELPELNVIWKTKVDDATAFAIYKMNSDFIIHGELSISRINKEGIIVWQNYGSDIFVLESGENCLNIKKNNMIHAQSWDKREYYFDYDGNVLAG